MPFGITHTTLRALGKSSAQSFFSRVEVVNGSHVPPEGEPVIVCANHWNTSCDPAVLSCFYPAGYRKLHYWAKSSLFTNKIAGYILLDAGNIPVDRSHKDNQKLFATTFDVLKYGETVAIFPEGGSWNVPQLLTLKDGASWAALEYAKNIRMSGNLLSNGKQSPGTPKDVTICIAGISYTNKTKYRSCAVMSFAPKISVEPYYKEFTVDPKSAVKKLTQAINNALLTVTVNAPDWDTLNAANMARRILWPNDRKIQLEYLRDIDQRLIDFLANPLDSQVQALKSSLLTYHQALKETELSHFALSGVPLPAKLDPTIPYDAPTRVRVLFALIKATFSSLIQLPFFFIPLIVHSPVYYLARRSLAMSDLEEDWAQNKMAVGTFISVIIYSIMGFAVWVMLLFTPVGAVLSLVWIWLFVNIHNVLIDNMYETAKQLRATWKILVGIWGPYAKSEAVAALKNVANFDVDQSKDENPYRRVLRLRLEATKSITELFDGQESVSANQQQLCASLLGWGAKVPSLKVERSQSFSNLKNKIE